MGDNMQNENEEESIDEEELLDLKKKSKEYEKLKEEHRKLLNDIKSKEDLIVTETEKVEATEKSRVTDTTTYKCELCGAVVEEGSSHCQVCQAELIW